MYRCVRGEKESSCEIRSLRREKVSGENLFLDYSEAGETLQGGDLPSRKGQIVLRRRIETPLGEAISRREIYDAKIDFSRGDREIRLRYPTSDVSILPRARGEIVSAKC